MALQEGNSTRAQFGHIVDDMRVALQEVYRWQVLDIRRSANGKAHSLAKFATRNVLDRVQTDTTCLDCIYDIYVT